MKDFLDDEMIPEDFSGGDMAQFESYEQLDVTNAKTKATQQAAALINQMCELYLDLEKITKEDYVKAVAAVEANNLTSLMLQVRYAEHALASIMRQLDGGGFVNQEIYETIIKLQANSINVTMQVSQYIRNLPEYFKYLEADVSKYTGTMSILESSTEDAKLLEESDSESFNASKPVRGMRELMLQITAEKENLNNEAEAIEVEESDAKDESLITLQESPIPEESKKIDIPEDSDE